MKATLAAAFAAFLIALATPRTVAVVHDGAHDFDYEFGRWNVYVSRLSRPVDGKARWLTYTGTHDVTPLWSGRANIGVLEVHGPAGKIEGLQLRLYNPTTHEWKLSFASSSDGELKTPMVGAFSGGVGDFRDVETVNGRVATIRSLSTPLSARSYRDVISRSYDGGKTWSPLWVAIYQRP